MQDLSAKNETISKVIQAAYRVRREMGAGLLERNYQIVMETEFNMQGIRRLSWPKGASQNIRDGGGTPGFFC